MSDRCTGGLTETASDFRCADVHQEKVCETYGGTSRKDKCTRKSSQALNVSLKTYEKGNKTKKTKGFDLTKCHTFQRLQGIYFNC